MKQHLRGHIYLDVKPIIAYVFETFGIQYSISGMTKLLHSINFEYKKPKLESSKAAPVEQKKWVDKNKPKNKSNIPLVYYH